MSDIHLYLRYLLLGKTTHYIMNKLFIVAAFIAISISSCKKSETDASPNQEVATVIDAKLLSNDWTSEMKLDNDKKWTANEETTTEVAKMRELIKVLPTTTIGEYQKLGADLTLEKNLLVKFCTMEGAAHDHLHTFLNPLTEKIDALQTIKSTEQGYEIRKALNENLQLFDTYFE